MQCDPWDRAKSGIYSILPISRLMFASCLESRTSTHVRVTWVGITMNICISSSIPLGRFRSSAAAVSPPSFPCRASLLTDGGGSERRRKLWCYVSTAQPQPKHWCVIITASLTNPEQSTRQAAVNKINFSPARPTTNSYKQWATWKSSFPAVSEIVLGYFGSIFPVRHTCSSPLQMDCHQPFWNYSFFFPSSFHIWSELKLLF